MDMNEHKIRVQIHAILDAHAEGLAAIRTAQNQMQEAFRAHDAALVSTIAVKTAIEAAQTLIQEAFTAHDVALVSAIEANRAALRLLNQVMTEGIGE
jgi:hypothetical protein